MADKKKQGEPILATSLWVRPGRGDYLAYIEQLRTQGHQPGASCPTADDLASFINFIETGRGTMRHIVSCPACLFVFAQTLRVLTEAVGPALWKRLGLSTRTANALSRDGVLTWDDLWTRSDLAKIPGIGSRGLEDLRRMFARTNVEEDPA